MSFGKTLLTVICVNVVFNLAGVGLDKLRDDLGQKREEREYRRAGFGEYESIYSGKKNKGPHARQIGFGAND